MRFSVGSIGLALSKVSERAWRLITLSAMLSAGVVMPAWTGVDGADGRLRHHCVIASCRATMTVGPTPIVWRSAERFGVGEILDIHVYVNGREPHSFSADLCEQRWTTGSAYAKVRTCAHPRTRITLRAVTLGPRVRVTITYQVDTPV